MKLTGKVAVVTGGLRGIGHAIAVAMAEEGADLLIAGLSMERAAQTEQEIGALGRRCVVVQADVADEAAVIKTLLEALGRSSVAADLARAHWSQAKTLRVKRMEPVWTSRGKLMPLHLARRADGSTDSR